MKEKKFCLDLQLFAEDDDNGENKDGLEESSTKKDVITMTQEQLNDRLKRESKNAMKKAMENMESTIALAVSKALEEREEKIKKQKDFESLTEEEKQNALFEEQKVKLEEMQRKMEEQQRQIRVSENVHAIMNRYDSDKLPNREKFKSIATMIANSNYSDEEKVHIYNDLKMIIEDTKKTAFQESLKQNPPKSGSSSLEDFASTSFAKNQNEKYNKGNANLFDWSKSNF